MSLLVSTSKSYAVSVETAHAAALGAITGLEGKLLSHNLVARTVEAKFDKKILGRLLGDRTQLHVAITQNESGEAVVAVEAYPLNAIGQRLHFGARKGVTETVVSWFYAHLEHRLPKPAAS